jgi:hypothetical protein
MPFLAALLSNYTMYIYKYQEEYYSSPSFFRRFLFGIPRSSQPRMR